MNAWQAIVMTTSIVGIVVWSVWISVHRKRWRYAVAPLTYFIHILALYICAIGDFFTPQFLNGWSNAVRVHGLLIFIAIGSITLAKWRQRWMSQ